MLTIYMLIHTRTQRGHLKYSTHSNSSQASKWLILTTELNGLVLFPPCIDSGFEWAIGVPGTDDALFIFGVNSFVRDNVLEIRRFSHILAGESPSAIIADFSMSDVLLWRLKLSFGRRLFMVNLVFDDEGPGDQLTFTNLGLGNGEKITLLGVQLGVWGMFILT